jgi:hypothetical protein
MLLIILAKISGHWTVLVAAVVAAIQRWGLQLKSGLITRDQKNFTFVHTCSMIFALTNCRVGHVFNTVFAKKWWYDWPFAVILQFNMTNFCNPSIRVRQLNTGPMLWFWKYLCHKIFRKRAFFAQTTDSVFKILLITLVIEKTPFFRRKLAKIVENCDHNIDPR